MTTEEKYFNLIREWVMPKSWTLYLDDPYRQIPVEHREPCIQAGIKRFDELYSEGHNLQICKMGADSAMHDKAKQLRDIPF